MKLIHWCSIALLGGALLAGAKFGLERQKAGTLRDELSLLREDTAERARLRRENQELVARLPSAATLEAWRGDQVAVLRMRAELETMKANLDQRQRALTEGKVEKAAEHSAR